MSEVRNASKIDSKLIAMISCIFVIVCSIVVIVISYIISYKYPVDSYELLIDSYYQNKMIHSTETVFNLLMAFFIIPSMIGIIIYLFTKTSKKLRNLMYIPLVSSILGAGLVIALYCLKYFILYKLIPNIIANPSDESLTDQFTNLIRITEQLSALAFILLYTIGTGVLGVITLRTSITGGNLSWLAIATGILAIGKIGYFMENYFGAALTLAASMGVILFLFWLGGFISILNQARKESKMNKMVDSSLLDENDLES